MKLNKKSQSGFIGKYGFAAILIIFIIIGVGNLIGVGDPNVNGNYSSNLTSLFGVDGQQYSYNPTDLIDDFNNVTTISATSGEGGEFQEFKVGQKQSDATVNVFTQSKNIVFNFLTFSELPLIRNLILGMIAIGLVVGIISFVRRYQL